MITKSTFLRFAWVCCLASTLLVAVPFAGAQSEKQHNLSEPVSTALQQKMKPLQDAKNWPGMLEVVESLLKTVPADSYDRAYLLQTRGALYLQLAVDDSSNTTLLPKVVESWEEHIKLSREKGYFEEKQLMETTKTLAQMVFYSALSLKDKAAQQKEFDRAAAYLRDYMSKNPKPEPDVLKTMASILLQQATIDPDKTNLPENQKKIAEARKMVEDAMLTNLRPKDQDYLLLLSIIEQQNNMAESAEMMELFLSIYPNRKDIWSLLLGRYVGLAQSAPENSTVQRNLYARAVSTIQRAQELGFLNTPKDYELLFTLYVYAGQTPLATETIYNGMKKGTMESTPKNWKYLASIYQQDNKELQAITTLKEAISLFPKDGNLDFMMGEVYRMIEKYPEAAQSYQRAITKGELDKPYMAHFLLALMQFELKDFENALKSTNAALATPDGAKDQQVKNLKEGIEQTIAETQALKEDAEKKK